MSVDQIVFGIAGAVCIAGAVTAVAHRDPRTAGVAFAGVLLGLAVLYAGLAAPAVAAAVIVVALFSTLPFVVHMTVPTSSVHAPDRPHVTGAALVVVFLARMIFFSGGGGSNSTVSPTFPTLTGCTVNVTFTAPGAGTQLSLSTRPIRVRVGLCHVDGRDRDAP